MVNVTQGWEPILTSLNHWTEAVVSFIDAMQGTEGDQQRWWRDDAIWTRTDGSQETFETASLALCEWCSSHNIDSASLWKVCVLIRTHSPYIQGRPSTGLATLAELSRSLEEAMLAVIRLQKMGYDGQGMPASIAGGSQAKSPPPQARISVDVVNYLVRIDGTSFSVNANAATIIDELVKAAGEYVSVSEMNDVRVRDLNSLPAEVEAAIERTRAKGCRIKPEFFA